LVTERGSWRRKHFVEPIPNTPQYIIPVFKSLRLLKDTKAAPTVPTPPTAIHLLFLMLDFD
jgi:hypothetical protein